MNLTEQQREIRKLLKEKDAILLAHYYQRGEIQDIADILGDSLALSMEAARTEARVLVFAGVHFMAESASILSPDKTVLLPKPDAGCPLADTIAPEALLAAKREHPGAAVVTYINSSAAIKALSDVCCTSANAVKIVDSVKDAREILMIPDGNLACYVAGKTDRKIIPWGGSCPVHDRLKAEEILAMKAKHPRAVFAAHPECRPEVLALADFVGSTTGIIRYAAREEVTEMLVGTEQGVLHPLRKQNPGKTFIPVSDRMLCEDMKRIALADIRDSLIEMKHVVKVPDEVRIPAKRALDRMLSLS